MEYLRRFTSQVRTRLLLVLLFDNAVFLLDWFIVEKVLHLDGLVLVITLAVVSALTLTLLPWLSTRYLTQPTKLISEAILHLAPTAAEQVVPSPDPAHARFGRELVTTLIHQVYELATVADRLKAESTQQAQASANFVADSLPLPLLLFDNAQVLRYANSTAATYLGLPANELVGKDLYSLLDMLFTTEETYDKWLQYVRANNATASQYWERVRLNPADTRPL
ncbi:MAG TPA: PAS domain-containing protein, partial [Candidatus Saccharimonadales bacterium]|nr:PAS domain-containing protein [Candidatus Saccharimonadales bacterium]